MTVIKKHRGVFLMAVKGEVHLLRFDPHLGDFQAVGVVIHHVGMVISDLAVVKQSLVSVADADDCVDITDLDFLALN